MCYAGDMSGSILKRVAEGHRQRRAPRVQMYLRLPHDLHAALEALAALNQMSFNALVVGVLCAALEEERRAATSTRQ